jgi:hypothetical protein
MVETVRVEVSEVGETAVDATQFMRPADYRNQKPVVSVPGL